MRRSVVGRLSAVKKIKAFCRSLWQNESHNDCVVMDLSAPSCEQLIRHLVHTTDPRRCTDDRALCTSSALSIDAMAHERVCLSNGEHVGFCLDFCYESYVYKGERGLKMRWGHANRTFLPLKN